MLTQPRRLLAVCVALSLGLAQTAQGIELISAEQVVQREQQVATAGDVRARLGVVLDRSDVAAALAERGVSADQARARVAALTDAEAASLLAEIDKAPAGASGELVGTLILVFVLLIFSDILGFTRIFPFLKPAR